MRSFAVQVSEAGKFQLHLAENKDLPDMPLDMYERKNLYLIFKEAVTNAAKYATCKNVWIEFSNRNNVLQMKIKDDGKGFDLSGASVHTGTRGGGNGLLNMKKRADDLRGELHITSEEGKGTEVLLRMKLKKS